MLCCWDGLTGGFEVFVFQQFLIMVMKWLARWWMCTSFFFLFCFTGKGEGIVNQENTFLSSFLFSLPFTLPCLSILSHLVLILSLCLTFSLSHFLPLHLPPLSSFPPSYYGKGRVRVRQENFISRFWPW